MIPEKVLNAIYGQLQPLVLELSRYNQSKNNSVKMEFETGTVTIKFK